MEASAVTNCHGVIAYLNLDQTDIETVLRLVQQTGIREAITNPQSPIYTALWRIVSQLASTTPPQLFPVTNILSPEVPLSQWNPTHAAAPFWTITQA